MQLFDDEFKQAMGELLRSEVRPVIREEIRGQLHEHLVDMRQDIRTIKTILGNQNMRLNELSLEMRSVKQTLRSHTSDLRRLDVLLEDVNERFAAARELRWD